MLVKALMLRGDVRRSLRTPNRAGYHSARPIGLLPSVARAGWL